jgi:hypothetical protein
MGKTNWKIVIPSYNRVDTLKEKTLSVLEEYKIPKDRIYVFVANEEQKALYQEGVGDRVGSIVVGVKGLPEVRNFIFTYFPKGTPLISFDDDVRGFLEYDPKAKRHERKLRDLKGMFERGFEECKQAKANFWGVYPIANGFFMKPTVSTDLKFIVGVCFGIINPGSSKLKIPVDMKTDYYITLRMYELDGGVIRMNNVAPKTAYYKEAGGIQADEGRQKKSKDAAEMLIKLYPEWVKLNPNRKSGFVEIRIKDSKKI